MEVFITISRNRSYDKQIKEKAVSLVIVNGKTIESVAHELEVPKITIAKWIEDRKDNMMDIFINNYNLIK